MSSDCPVCPVSETAAPHRMGAALTYDDLDAPDLTAPTDQDLRDRLIRTRSPE
jgi:hypothetical protein